MPDMEAINKIRKWLTVGALDMAQMTIASEDGRASEAAADTWDAVHGSEMLTFPAGADPIEVYEVLVAAGSAAVINVVISALVWARKEGGDASAERLMTHLRESLFYLP